MVEGSIDFNSISQLAEVKHQFVSRLTIWLKANKRDFPWRHSTNPYHILIAEILLQRTKAEQVKPVYDKFIRIYPTPKKLAEAQTDEIEKLILSLGLRKKIVMIKQLAKDITENFNGDIPGDEKALLKLTGVGHYTANAVLCFAFGMDLPVVDWNVARVFKRFLNYPQKSAPHADKIFIEFVSDFILEGHARDFNFAILDFAAIICTPRKPDCMSCPVSDLCSHYKKVLDGTEQS